MDTNELKFLLKLLGSADCRAPLSKIKPNSKTSATEGERICRKLHTRELVGCSYEITKFKIASPGKALLKLDPAKLPVTPQELKILKACEKQTISPGKTGIPEAERQTAIQSLADRGLIQVDKKDKKIKEVWLTEHGKEELREKYDPSGGGNITITKNMLADYLRFLRKSLSSPQPEAGQTATVPLQGATHKPSDEEIFQTIVNLDRELGTGNYLPIFHLRQKLEPPLSREDLDQALYRLEGNNQIELSALVEASRYSQEQVNSGIKQRSGSPLFFIKVTAN
jgi:DNA-binding MarR family transcriptional regulator